MTLSFRSIAVFVALLFFAREGLDGVLRYVLGSYGLSFLVYLPTALMVVFVVLHFLAHQRRDPQWISVVLLTLFGVSGIMGFLNSGSLAQTLFALYVFFPFFFGFQTGDLLFTSKLVKRAIVFLTLLFAFGVFLEMGTELPWKGFSYEIGGMQVQGSRIWSSLGLERLSGFSRFSFSIAILCMAFLVVLYGRVKPFLYFVLFVVGGAAIVLTTTKGVVLVMLLMVLLWVFVKPHSGLLYHLGLKWGLVLTFIVGLILPVSTYWVVYSLNLDDLISRIVFLSFEMRLGIVWPHAMESFTHFGDFIVGRGAGQMGVAQMMYDQANYNPGDNMYLYLLVVFGLPSLLLLALFLYRLFKLNGTKGYVNYLLMAVFIFVYGIFANVMESAVLSYFLGSLIAVAFREKHTKKAL